MGDPRDTMSRINEGLRPWSECGHGGPHRIEENMMAKYLLLKHPTSRNATT